MGVTNCYVDWPETGRSRIVLEAKAHNRLHRAWGGEWLLVVVLVVVVVVVVVIVVVVLFEVCKDLLFHTPCRKNSIYSTISRRHPFCRRDKTNISKALSFLCTLSEWFQAHNPWKWMVVLILSFGQFVLSVCSSSLLRFSRIVHD